MQPEVGLLRAAGKSGGRRVSGATWIKSERFAAAECEDVCAPAQTISSPSRGSKRSWLGLVEINE